MKRIPHPSGTPVLFDAKWHQYKLGETALRSVSRLLDRHFPFDEARVLALVSRKTGAPVEVVKRGWAQQAVLGKNIHEFIECRLTGRPPPIWAAGLPRAAGEPPETPPKADKNDETDEKSEKMDEKTAAALGGIHGEEGLYLPAVEAAVARVVGRYDVLAVEQVVASPEWGLAGTIDLLARDKQTGGLLLADWKTTGGVRSSFRFGSFEGPGAGCLRHLPNAKSYRYAMQLLLYGAILKQQRYVESGFFDAALAKSARRTSPAAPPVSLAALREAIAGPVEYGLVQFAKDDEGGVVAEFKRVEEATVLPPDDHEMSFSQLMQKVMLAL
ncbi:unnamed protein product [Phytomonas sp. Hart1]|nr:unnamed protein product [Phytomonas sp. Hart1]|eukprot:CCW71819.1 unnamed protein product [Phytomonas sp. isolate Hart1]